MKNYGMIEIIEKRASEVPISKQSIYRYLGFINKQPDFNLSNLIETCLAEFLPIVQYRACYTVVSIQKEANFVNLCAFNTNSISLERNLVDCEHAILFAATIGMATEQQRKRTSISSMAQSVVLDAIGTAAVESFCDVLCQEWGQQFAGNYLRPRFSPGYGDLPLDLQLPLLSYLDSGRKIGVTLTDSLLMVPQKSVSAIVGVGKNGCTTSLHDCTQCAKSNCEFRL